MSPDDPKIQTGTKSFDDPIIGFEDPLVAKPSPTTTKPKTIDNRITSYNVCYTKLLRYVNEISDLTFDSEGVVGMANSGADSNGSQFFITYDAQPDLDGSYTVFGKVVSGMDVVQNLTAVDASSGVTADTLDKILSISISEK